MIHLSLDTDQPKGWYVGPWNSAVSIPIGYANEGIDETHYHTQMFEVYLVARGTSTAVVGEQEIQLQAGDMLVVEPGEAHTFRYSSADYLHFVIQTPFVPDDKMIMKRQA
jgi:mannose-6-phosphate isomerase-like protein (cupin superfamily)